MNWKAPMISFWIPDRSLMKKSKNWKKARKPSTTRLSMTA